MTALYIIIGIIAFFTLLAMVRITFEIKVEEQLDVYLKILFVKLRLYPKKEKPVNIKSFRIKKFRKMRIKEEKKYRKKQNAKLNKDAKKKKGSDSGSGGQTNEDAEDKKSKRSFSENILFGIRLVKYVISRSLGTFGRYLVISIYKVDITVGGDEPDKIGITYGCVCQAVSYLNEFVNQNFNVKYKKVNDVNVSVNADFISRKNSFRIQTAFSIRVWQIVATAISALIGYLKMPPVTAKNKKVSSKNNSKDKDPVIAGQEVTYGR